MVKYKRRLLDFAHLHPAWIVLIAALLFRISMVLLAGDFIPQSPDKINRYDQIAMNLMSGKGFALKDKPTAISGPVYPVLLAGLYVLFGKSLLMVRLFFALFDALSCLLFYLVVRRYFEGRVPFLTAIALIFSPYSLYAVLTVTIDIPFLLLHALFFFYFGNATQNGRNQSFFISGIWLGTATLCRAVSILLPLFLLPVTTLITPKIRKGLSHWFIFLIGFLLMVSPWIARNYAVFHKFIPVQTLGGHHLYSAAVTGKEWYEESIRSPKMNQVERDEFYYKRAWDRIKQDPTRFVRSMGTRFVDMWYRTESGRFETPLLYANFTLLSLALLGILLTRKKWRILLMFYMVILYYIFLHMALTAVFRYVLPIIPLLLPFAMVPVDRLFSRIKSPRI